MRAPGQQEEKVDRYRLVIGEVGSERGHVQATGAQTVAGANIALGKALSRYDGDGWGYVAILRVSGQDSQSGQDEWERL